MRPLSVVTLVTLLAACSSTSHHKISPAGESVEIPRTWKLACQQSGSCDPRTVSGSVPAKLARPLHFPSIAARRCPASPGHYLATPTFGAMTLGDGHPVRIALDNAGDLRRGQVTMGAGESAGWYSIKTHFVSAPDYQGPFSVRVRRLDSPGPVRLGATPAQPSWAIVPAGPTANGSAGWREVPYFTFLRAPGLLRVAGERADV